MSLNISLSPLQKTVLLLLVNHTQGRETKFQDLVSYLERDKSQVSVLLTTLEESGCIERSTTRPQKITLTEEGRELTREHLIASFEDYVTKINTVDQNTKKNSLSGSDKKSDPILKTSAIIEFILEKVGPQIEQDLKTIDEYITAEQFEMLRDSLLERFESIITFVFSRLDLHKKPSTPNP